MGKPSKRIPGVSQAEAARRCKALGKKLKARRLELDIRQAEVARRCGWEPTRIWKFEKGHSLPSTHAIGVLAKALHLDADDLYALRDGSNGKNGNGKNGHGAGATA
jgi:transcriptional regulator with XRE-family HTH domain